MKNDFELKKTEWHTSERMNNFYIDLADKMSKE